MYNKKALKVDLGKYKKPNAFKGDIITDPMGQWKYPGQPTRIPGNDITMQGVPYPVLGIDNTGYAQMMYPGMDYTFPGNYVDEYPQMKKGGSRPALPKKKSSKAYSKSLTATNKLFAQSSLTKKSKSKKNKIFDPNAKYFQTGGTKLNAKDEALFQKFFNTLPDNLMDDDPSYDIRGYWDSEGRPTAFNYDQPKESDGFYHAYSINANTGEYLKAPTHPTFQHAVHEDRKIGYRPITNVYGRNIATENPSLVEPEAQSFLRNMLGPVSEYQDGGVSPLEGNLISKVIMNRNRGVDFVDRAYALGANPGTRMFNVPDDEEFGSYMSHKMATGEDDSGQTWMFPTVLNPNNEGIQVPNQYADYISSEGYKVATGMKRKGGFQDDINKRRQVLRDWTYGQSIGMLQEKQYGGDYIETELDDEEIEELRKGGYIVEDISIPSLTKAQIGLIQSPYKRPTGVQHPMQVAPQKQTKPKTTRTYDPLYDVKPQVANTTAVKNNQPIKTLTELKEDSQYDINKEELKNDFNKTVEYYKDYHNSPMYKKMLSNSIGPGENLEFFSENRSSNLASLEAPTVLKSQPIDKPNSGGWSSTDTGNITVAPKGYKVQGILPHEISHSIDRPQDLRSNRLIPINDINAINKFKPKNFFSSPGFQSLSSEDKDALINNREGNKNYLKEKREWIDYVGEPTETRARLNDIRMQSKFKGLYDPFTQKVTPNIYKKLLNTPFEKEQNEGFDALKQLKGLYTDEQIQWMLNNISKNDANNEELTYAQKGGFKDNDYFDTELTDAEIEEYRKGGYIVEDISVPGLTKAQIGMIKSPYKSPAGTKHPMEVKAKTQPKLITYKNNASLIDGTANFDMISKVPISQEYNDQIKQRLYTGNYGFNTETGALFLLPESQRTKVSQDVKNIRAKEEDTKDYNESVRLSGGIDPKMMNPETTWSDAQREEFIRQGYNAAMFNPVFKTASYFTPWGAAIGTLEGLTHVAKDLGEGDYVSAGIDAATTLPFVPKQIRTAAKEGVKNIGSKAVDLLPKYKNVYRVEPTTFTKDVSDPLSGRWFGSLEEMPFYVKNLKDPDAGVRIMRTKMPVKKWESVSGVNMPKEAKQMSGGTGQYKTFMDAVKAGELSPGAAKRLTTGTHVASDINELMSNPNLINLSEGILSDKLANQIRIKLPSSKFSRSSTVEFPEGNLGKEGAFDYIYNINKDVEKPILGIPRYYFPFEEGGFTDDDILETELSPEEIDWYLANGYDLELLPDDYELPEAQEGLAFSGKKRIESVQEQKKAEPVKQPKVVAPVSQTNELAFANKRPVADIKQTIRKQPQPMPNTENVFASSPWAYQSLSKFIEKNPIEVAEPEQKGMTSYGSSLLNREPLSQKEEGLTSYASNLLKGRGPLPDYGKPAVKSKVLTSQEENDLYAKLTGNDLTDEPDANTKIKKYQGKLNDIDKNIQKVYYDLTNPNMTTSEKTTARKQYKELTTKRSDYIKAINYIKREDVGWFDAKVNEAPTLGKPFQKWGMSDQPSYMTYDLPKFESYTDKQKKQQEEFKQSKRFENLNPNKSEFTRWKFRAAASNDDPIKVVIYGTRGERSNQNIGIDSPGAIMHFLDQSPKSGWVSPETQTFYRNLKDNEYLGYLKPNEDGTHSVQYLPKKDFAKDDLYKNTFLVRQIKYDDINFNSKVTDDNFAGHTYPTIKNTKQVALPISSDPDENVYDYSSGQSVVFIFKYNGKVRYQHFAGSRNDIKKEGQEIKKMYNLKDGSLVIGLADAGSYSSAVSGKITNDKLNSKDYGYYNANDNTGAGMAIVTD